MKIKSNYRYFKTGGMPEWYNFELTKTAINNESKEFKNNSKIKIKIVDISAKETELELEKTEQVKNIINIYCKKKGISNSENYYLTKMDLDKLDENLTIKEADIPNNQTLYIFERDKIEFVINYQEKEFKISGNKDDKFESCIKSFLDENGNDNFDFTLNGENIEITKELNELGIKNGDVIKAEQI